MTQINLNHGEMYVGTITPANDGPYHLIVLPYHANEIDWRRGDCQNSAPKKSKVYSRILSL